MPRAPRVCGEPNCSALVHDPKRRKCDTHYQPFGGKGGTSSRTTTSDHRRRRLRVLKRDGYRCQLNYPNICLGVATECDHIIPLWEGGADTDIGCQSVCRACHRVKSGREGSKASHA